MIPSPQARHVTLPPGAGSWRRRIELIKKPNKCSRQHYLYVQRPLKEQATEEMIGLLSLPGPSDNTIDIWSEDELADQDLSVAVNGESVLKQVEHRQTAG